jgi:hypothetical protein
VRINTCLVTGHSCEGNHVYLTLFALSACRQCCSDRQCNSQLLLQCLLAHTAHQKPPFTSSLKSAAATTISTVLAATGQRCSVATCKLNHMRSQRQQCTKCQQEPAARCHHTTQTVQRDPSQSKSILYVIMHICISILVSAKGIQYTHC